MSRPETILFKVTNGLAKPFRGLERFCAAVADALEAIGGGRA